MSKCISLVFNRMNECLRKTFIRDEYSYHNHEDEEVSLKSSNFQAIQKSTLKDILLMEIIQKWKIMIFLKNF